MIAAQAYQSTVNKQPFLINPADITVVGILGKAHSGKGTIAQIATRQEFGYTELEMARSLKKAARVIFHLDYDSVSTEDGKKGYDGYWELTNRRILQLLGTEAMQPTFGKEVWCKSSHIEMYKLWSQVYKSAFIFSDIRFSH